MEASEQQTSLTFPEPKIAPSTSTLNGIVLSILLENPSHYWTPWHLCEAILHRHHVRISDSSCTARLRDLRKPEYGGYVIEKRKRAGSNAYEYRLGGNNENR